MRLGHIPALDAIRGIAILLVLTVHVHHVLPGGVLGVDLFFVLSGFLITSLLLSEWGRDGSVSLRAFYRRRALRLLPALVLMLGVVTVALAFTSDDFDGSLVWILFSLGYVINIAAIVNSGITEPTMQPMWSLSQEEQFYLVWPLLLPLALRRGMDGRRIAVILAGFAGGLILYRTFLASADATPAYLLYSPESRSFGLVVGCLAGVLFSFSLVRRVPLWLAGAMLAPAAVSILLLDLESRWDAVTLVPLFCLAAATIVLACVLHPQWWFVRLIDRAWLRGLGRISYGLYLWHWPLYYAFGWKLGLPLAIVVAIASYRFVERPFLRRRYQTATAPRRKSTISPVVAPGPNTAATPSALSSSASS
jgi:peptidoglycan/LPS O-acetylase OafA/YrhL